MTPEQRAERLLRLKAIGKASDNIPKGVAGQPASAGDLTAQADRLEGVQSVLGRFKGKVAGSARENVGRKISHFRNIADLVTERSSHKSGSSGYNAATNRLNNAVNEYIVSTNPGNLADRYRSFNETTGRREVGAGGSLDARMATLIPRYGETGRFNYSRKDIDLGTSDNEAIAMAQALGLTNFVKDYAQKGRSAFSGSRFMTAPGLHRVQRRIENDPNNGKVRPSSFFKNLTDYEQFSHSDLAPPIPRSGSEMSRPNMALNKERRKESLPQLDSIDYNNPEHVQGLVDTIVDFGIPAARSVREQANLASALRADSQLNDFRNNQGSLILAGGQQFANIPENSGPSRSVMSAPNLIDVDDGDGSGMMLQGNINDDYMRDKAAIGADRAVEEFVRLAGPEYELFARQWVTDNQDRVRKLGNPQRVAESAFSDWIGTMAQPETIASPTSPFANHYAHFDTNTGSVRYFDPESVPASLRGDYTSTAKGLADEVARVIAEGNFQKWLSDSQKAGIQLGAEVDINRMRGNFEAMQRASDSIKAMQEAKRAFVQEKIRNGEPLTPEDTEDLPLWFGDEMSSFNAADAQALTIAAQYQNSMKNYKDTYGRYPDDEVRRSRALSEEEEAMQIANRNEMGENDGFRPTMRIIGSSQDDFGRSVPSAKHVSKDVTDIDLADWDSVRNGELMRKGSIAISEKTAFRPDVDDQVIGTVNDDGSTNTLIATFSLDNGKGRSLTGDDADYVVDQLREAGYVAAYDHENGTIEVVNLDGKPIKEWLGSVVGHIEDQTGISVRNGDFGRTGIDIGRVYTQKTPEYGADLSRRDQAAKVRQGLRRRKPRA